MTKVEREELFEMVNANSRLEGLFLTKEEERFLKWVNGEYSFKELEKL